MKRTIIIILITFIPAIAASQKSNIGIGVNLMFPDIKIGLDFFGTNLFGETGLYVSAGMNPSGFSDPSEKDDFYANISQVQAEEQYGDDQLRTRDVNRLINAGVILNVNECLHPYAGLGISIENAYGEYYDPSHILSNDGKYWIELDSRTSFNVNGGMYFFLNPDEPRSVFLNLGINTTPTSFIFGVGYRL